MFNVVVGVIWQITLMTTPVFLVIREYPQLIVCLAVLVVTSVTLKLNWWNKLNDSYGEAPFKERPVEKEEVLIWEK
jgi:hypothetical protein